MRDIRIGKDTVRVRATALTLIFYKQEFSSDLVGDLLKMEQMENDPTKVDTVILLQITWAMAKSEAFAQKKPHPGFFDWMNEIESLNMSDTEFITAVVEEAVAGFLSGK